MDSWDIVEFPSIDHETSGGLFKNKNGIEAATLHEVCTVATVTSSIQIKEFPSISTAVSNGQLCLGIDASVVVLAESFHELRGIVKSDSVVNCLALSQDSAFLFTCLNDGNISITYLPHNKCILKKRLVEDVKDVHVFNNIFVIRNSENGTWEILILTANGHLFHFINVHLDRLKTALEDGALEELDKILSEISNYEVTLECIYDCTLIHYGHCNFLLMWGANIHLLSLKDHEIKNTIDKIAFNDEIITKARANASGHQAFVLSRNKMYLLCLKTFIVTETFEDLKIDDFVLIESVEYSGVTTFDTKILFLTGFESSQCALHLYLFPCFQEIYSIEICPYSRLIEMAPNQDCILFLENGQKDDVVNPFNIRKITEASCEAQLSRLLNKHLFEEAFEFAMNFNLDMEGIYKAKAAHLLDQLSPWKDAKLSANSIAAMKADLLKCLDKIYDIQYIISFCINAVLPDFETTLDMLLFAKVKFNAEKINDSKLLTQILQTLKKLETFQLLYGTAQFRSSWDGFLHTNLWEEFIRCLSHEKFENVSLLWERHVDDFLQFVQKKDIVRLLETVPEALISDVAVCQWLKHSVFPAVLYNVDDSLACVATWIIQTSSMLELTAKCEWPNNAITFVEMFLDVCQELTSNATSMNCVTFDLSIAVEFGKKNESVMHKLHQLLDSLNDLKELRQDYNCKISLTDYLQENKQAVVFHLLNWVNGPEEIPTFANKFLKSFSKRHELIIDDVIHDYIMDVIDYSVYNWWLCEEPPWEKQIVALIHCLKEDKLYLNSICKMLQTIPVPWSQCVQEMVNNSIKLEHPMVIEIKREIDSIDKNTILMKYGFQRTVDILDANIAEIVTRNIITHENDAVIAMKDALVIVNSANLNVIDVYIFQMKYLIDSHRFSDCVSLLESLPRDIVVPCCKRLAIFAAELSRSSCPDESPSLQLHLFTKIAIFALNHLKSLLSAFDFEDYSDLLKQLESSLGFQTRFGTCVNIESLESICACEDIFEANVQSFLQNQELLIKKDKVATSMIEHEWKQSKTTCAFCHLIQLSKLLGVKQVRTLEIIAKKAFLLDNIDLCIYACGELCYPNLINVESSILLELVGYFFDNWRKDGKVNSFTGDIIHIMENLISSAAIACEPVLLERCSFLAYWVSLLKSWKFKSQGEHLEFSNTVSLSGTDPYYEWTFSTLYKENAFQVALENIVPHINRCIQNSITDDFLNENNTLKSTISSLLEMITHLKSKGQMFTPFCIYVKMATMLLMDFNENLECTQLFLRMGQEKQKLILSSLIDVFGQRRLDYPLTLGLLLNLPKDVAAASLQAVEVKCGFEYRKLQRIAIVGKAFSQCWALPMLTIQYQELQKDADWGNKFSQLHINFKDTFRKTGVEKMEFVHRMANHPQINLQVIQRYCSDFNLDLDEALLIVLNSLLTSIYNKEMHNLTQQKMPRNQSQALEICSLVIHEINNKSLILDKLCMTYNKTDPYNYEILEFILENMVHIASYDNWTIVENAKNELIVLNFLKKYKRISEPSEFELDLWLDNSEFSIDVEKIKDRLPYHSLVNPANVLKVLAPELNATTVNIWLEIAPFLKLQANTVIMKTVENLVRQVVPKLDSSIALHKVWTVLPPNKQLIRMMYELVSRIDDLEIATVCATSIVKRLPPSTCKAIATKGAISFAKKWWDTEKNEKAKQAMDGLRKLHCNLYTKQIVYEHDLDSPIYSALIDQPQELIYQLYEHPSIEQRYWFNSNKFPDIHGACEQIACVTQSDLENLQLSLLSKWLLPMEFTTGGLDETMNDEFCFQTNEFNSEDDPVQKELNLKRTIYLLQKGSMKDNAAHLISVLRSTSSTVSNGHKLRTLKCLLHIADLNTIQHLTNMDMLEIRSTARNLFYRAQLEHLNIACNLPSICNAESAHDVTVQLLQSQNHNPIALMLAAELCYDTQVFLPQIWNTILRRMIDSKAYKSLKDVLLMLSSHSVILQLPEFVKAWNAILQDDTMDKGEPVRGFNKLILLHRCPLLLDLDLLSLADYFNQVSLPVLTIDCFLHLPIHSLRMQHIKDYLSVTNTLSLLQHLKELRQIASSFYHLDEITKIIFLSLANKKLNSSFTRSPLVEHFLHDFGSNKQQLNNLVKYAIQNDMLTECAGFLQKYTLLNQDSEFAKEIKKRDSKEMEIIKIYSEMNKLDEVHHLLNMD